MPKAVRKSLGLDILALDKLTLGLLIIIGRQQNFIF